MLPWVGAFPADGSFVDLALLAAFVVFGLVCWYFRISYRVSIVAGLGFLVVAGVAVALGQEDVGNFLAILTYYFIVVGVVLAIVEYRRERSQKDPVPVSTESPRSLDRITESKRTYGFREALEALWRWLHR